MDFCRTGFSLSLLKLCAPARDCPTLSLDVRLGPPCLGSLRVRFAFGDQSAYGGSMPLPALAPTARFMVSAAPSLLVWKPEA